MRRATILLGLVACGDEPLGAWQAPVSIAQLAGDDPSLTGDMLELYFNHDSQDIYVMTRMSLDEPFSDASPVIELNTPMWEATPEVSADGLVMLLASDRNGGNLDLWLSRRTDRGAPWGPPVIVQDLASPEHDFSASMSADELAIVFARPSNGRDLFAASRGARGEPWSEVAQITELVTSADDSEPHLSSDGLTIVFSSTRPGLGSTYEARRESRTTPFGAPIPIEVARDGVDPWMSPDRRHLFFMRGAGELWMSAR